MTTLPPRRSTVAPALGHGHLQLPVDPGGIVDRTGTPAPDDVPTRIGSMCGACGAGRYLCLLRHPHRVVCTRCRNGRPLLG